MPPCFFQKLLVIKTIDYENIKDNICSYDVNQVKNPNMDMISIVIDEKDLIGKSGIYLLENCFKTGKRTKRMAQVEYFGADEVLTQEAYVRIAGQSSRIFLQKSFRLESVKDDFSYDFFGINDNVSYLTLNLKNGGNNCDGFKLKNSLIQDIASRANCHFDTQNVKPVTVYLNGEYWGLYFLTEDYNRSYLKNKYDINDNAVILQLKGTEHIIEEGEDRDVLLWNNMIEYVKLNSMECKECYAEVCDMMDVESFAEWLAFELYIDNFDCIYDWGDGDNNIYVWRTKMKNEDMYNDGRWRWMLLDVDLSLNAFRNTAEEILRSSYTSDTRILFQKLILNEAFRELLISKLYKMRDEVFEVDICKGLLDEYIENCGDELRKTYSRFGIDYDLEEGIMWHYYYFENRGYFVDDMVQSIIKFSDENKIKN